MKKVIFFCTMIFMCVAGIAQAQPRRPSHPIDELIREYAQQIRKDFYTVKDGQCPEPAIVKDSSPYCYYTYLPQPAEMIKSDLMLSSLLTFTELKNNEVAAVKWAQSYFDRGNANRKRYYEECLSDKSLSLCPKDIKEVPPPSVNTIASIYKVEMTPSALATLSAYIALKGDSYPANHDRFLYLVRYYDDTGIRSSKTGPIEMSTMQEVYLSPQTGEEVWHNRFGFLQPM